MFIYIHPPISSPVTLLCFITIPPNILANLCAIMKSSNGYPSYGLALNRINSDPRYGQATRYSLPLQTIYVSFFPNIVIPTFTHRTTVFVLASYGSNILTWISCIALHGQDAIIALIAFLIRHQIYNLHAKLPLNN